MRGLKDRTVVVTGGAGGIGRAIALRLGEEGANVGILDLNGDGAVSVADEVARAESSGKALGIACDISDYDAVEAAVDTVEEKLGPVFGLVNNAGWDEAHNFVETDRPFWQKVVSINLYGPLNATHVVLKRLATRGEGRIVSIASDAGRVGSSGEAVYAACKGGIAAFMKTLAREHSRQGLTFNTVCPGPTDTTLLDGFDPSGKLKEALAKAIPMRRLGRPEDFPGIVSLLLSDDGGFITGQTISVSGGLSMNG